MHHIYTNIDINISRISQAPYESSTFRDIGFQALSPAFNF